MRFASLLFTRLAMFEQMAARIPFTDPDQQLLEATLISDPLAGDLVPGAGGVRKVRAAAKGKGKQGGARVIYFYVAPRSQVYLIAVYAKDRASDLTPAGKQRLKALAKILVEE